MIIRYFTRLLSGTVYLRIRRNRITLRHIQKKIEVDLLASEPFSTSRLLVGQFTIAHHLLREGMRRLFNFPLSLVAPTVLIHPLEMSDGGLSQVESRVLRELADINCASETHIWDGPELSDPQVLEVIRMNKDSYNKRLQGDGSPVARRP